jgi:Peptidase family M28
MRKYEDKLDASKWTVIYSATLRVSDSNPISDSHSNNHSMKIFSFLFAFCAAVHLFGQGNQPPVLSSIGYTLDTVADMLVVQYDVSDPEGDPLEIILQYSTDHGYTYMPVLASGLPIPVGDVGYPVSPGTGKEISFDTAPFQNASSLDIRITALDRQPLDIAALVAQVDSTRLKNRVKWLEGVRHRTAGATHLKEVQDSIIEHFIELELGFKQANFVYTGYTARNIIGNRSAASTSHQTVIVDAHYDTVNNSPGADDNGSGTAGMMEIANILAQYPSKKGLRYIGFDLEETGLTGSQNYVTNLAPADSISAVLNFEMIGFYDTMANTQTLPTGFNILFPAAYNQVASDGFRGNFITNVGNANSTALVTKFNMAAQTYVPGLKVIDVVSPGNGSAVPDLLRSDHAPFWLSGRQALMLTDGANFRNLNYHTANDKADKLNYRFMQQVVQATLATACDVAEVQHGTQQSISIAQLTEVHDLNMACSMQVSRSQDALTLRTKDCTLDGSDVLVSIFDTDGRLLSTQQLTLFADTQKELTSLVDLPALVAVRVEMMDGKLVFSGLR